MSLPTFPIAIADLIPQALPMLLLDDLIEAGEGLARGVYRVREDHLFVDSAGRLDAVAAVEMMAQLTAAMRGYESLTQGSAPKHGFLTGLQDVAFSPGVIRNEELAIDITRQFAMETMFFVDGRVSRGDEILVQGTLKVFEMETPPETSGVGAGAMNPAQLNRSGSPVKEALLDLLRMDSGSGFFRFEPGFPGFQGHFPGAPILPGVVMLLAGQVVAEKLTGKPLRIRTIDRAKFMQPVFPRQELRVDVTLADPEPFVADIRLTRDGQAVSTCRFTAEEA